jgi:hypothetical protein
MAVAAEADGVFHIGRRQELGLADLAGPVAPHVGGGHGAAVDAAQCIHELGLKFVAAPAIIGERRHRADHR